MLKSLKTNGMEELPEQEETEQEETEQEETVQEEKIQEETESKCEIIDTVQNIIKLLKTMDKNATVKLLY